MTHGWMDHKRQSGYQDTLARCNGTINNAIYPSLISSQIFPKESNKMQLDVEVNPPANGVQMNNLQIHKSVQVISYKA